MIHSPHIFIIIFILLINELAHALNPIPNPGFGGYKISGKDSSRLSQFNSMMLGADYSSNNSTYGNVNTDVSQPNYSGIISFTSKYGLDASCTYTRVANSDTSFSSTTWETDLEAGYRVHLPFKLYLYGSYARFIFSDNTATIQSEFKNQFELDAGYEGRYWNPVLTGFYLTGSQNEFMLNVQNSFVFSLDNFPFRNTTLLLQPEADLMFSNQQFYNEYLLQQVREHPWYYLWKWKRYGLTKEDIIRKLESEKKFTYTSFMMTVPVSWMAGNFMVTGGISALKPLQQPSFLDDSWVLMMNVTLSYIFMW